MKDSSLVYDQLKLTWFSPPQTPQTLTLQPLSPYFCDLLPDFRSSGCVFSAVCFAVLRPLTLASFSKTVSAGRWTRSFASSCRRQPPAPARSERPRRQPARQQGRPPRSTIPLLTGVADRGGASGPPQTSPRQRRRRGSVEGRAMAEDRPERGKWPWNAASAAPRTRTARVGAPKPRPCPARVERTWTPAAGRRRYPRMERVGLCHFTRPLPQPRGADGDGMPKRRYVPTAQRYLHSSVPGYPTGDAPPLDCLFLSPPTPGGDPSQG